MAEFLFKRFLQTLLVLFVISFIAFMIQDNLGDPLREMVGISTSQEEIQKLRTKLGLDDPFSVRYLRFLSDAAQGNLGVSYFFRKPTTQVILEKFPATMELVIASVFLIVLISIPSGVYCAVNPKSILSKFIIAFSIVGISVPVFLTAILSIYLFAVYWNWLPSFGRGETVMLLGFWDSGFFTWDGLQHLLLPAVSLSSITLPLFIRLVRAEMMEILGTEYVRFAKAKGLKTRRVLYVHALKNTLLPVVTMGGLQIGTLIAYTILTETVFQWPGMGFMFLEAVKRSDIPLITAYLMFVGLVFVITNTLVDLLYGLINPTVRISSES